MIRTPHFIALSIILLLAMAGCGSPGENLDDRPQVEVISAKANYPQLLEKALEWDEDAYLDHLDLYLDPPEGIPLISAHFLSPSEDYESLEVRIEISSKFSVERIKWEH